MRDDASRFTILETADRYPDTKKALRGPSRVVMARDTCSSRTLLPQEGTAMVYAGSDLHKQYAHVAVMDAQGKLFRQVRLPNDPARKSSLSGEMGWRGGSSSSYHVWNRGKGEAHWWMRRGRTGGDDGKSE